MKGLAEVLAEHGACAQRATVEIHKDRSGTMHYPCGVIVAPVRGLVAADRAHVEVAVLDWLRERLAGAREDVAEALESAEQAEAEDYRPAHGATAALAAVAKALGAGEEQA